MGKPSLLYVETVAEEALDLSEDIVCLSQAKELLRKTRDRFISGERIDEVYNLINAMEREARFYLRHKYLEGKPKPVSQALRKRLEEEIKKENSYGKI